MNKYGNDHLPVYVCSHVFENTRPILLVVHSEGDWQFLCGGEHEEDEIPKVIGIIHLVKRDPSLNELYELPDNCEAERTEPGAKWVITECGFND